jgi:uncharacterized membrane-anchored protein
MLLASACGTNVGDFASQTLDLGFLGAFVPFMMIFAAMFAVARLLQSGGEIFYWAMIVISRAGATDIADLASHQLKLSYPALATVLLILLGSLLMIGSRFGRSTIVTTRYASGQWDDRPNAHGIYWAAMVTASVIGTMSGDYLADDPGIGVGLGAAVLLLLTAATATLSARGQQRIKPLYWLTVLLMRSGATNLGDYVSGDGGLKFGLVFGSLGFFCLTLAVVVAWKGQAAPDLQDAAVNGHGTAVIDRSRWLARRSS